jgi:ribosome-associated protein
LAKELKAKTPVKKKVAKVSKASVKRTVKAKIKKDNTTKLLEIIVDSIEDKKGENIVTLDLTKLKFAMADYFIICHASNKIQVEAIVQHIEEKVFKKLKEEPFTTEGRHNAEWILMDYFNVVVHVFLAEKRDYYGLEALWADANEVKNAAGS